MLDTAEIGSVVADCMMYALPPCADPLLPVVSCFVVNNASTTGVQLLQSQQGRCSIWFWLCAASCLAVVLVERWCRYCWWLLLLFAGLKS